MNDAAYATSPFASARGLPCSRVMSAPRSSWFRSMRSLQRRRIAARSFAVRARHSGQAVRAASIARAVSGAPIMGTRPILSPVAGLVTGIVSPESAAAHAPPT